MVRPTLVRWILAAQEWHRKAFAGSRPAIKFLKIQATVFADCRSLLAGALAHVHGAGGAPGKPRCSMLEGENCFFLPGGMHSCR